MKDKIDTPVFIVFLIGAFVFSCMTFVLGIWVSDSSHKIDQQLSSVKVVDDYSDELTADDMFKEENKIDKNVKKDNLEESPAISDETDSFENKSVTKDENVIESKKEVEKKPSLKVDKAATKIQPKKEKAEIKKTSTNKNEKEKVVPKKQYYVQIIATSNKEVALKEKIKFERKGYNVFLVNPKKGDLEIYKVRIGTFSTKEQANKIAAKISKEYKIKPWVL